MPEIRITIPENMDIALQSLVRAGIAGNKAEVVRGAISQYLSQVPTILSKDYDMESVFSPDGRILQVEYAMEASNKGLVSIGMLLQDGLILVKDSPQKVFSPNTSEYFRPLKKISNTIEISIAGISTDGNLVLSKAKDIVLKKPKIDIYELAEQLSFFLHGYTLEKNLRVLGTKLIVGGLNSSGNSSLFLIGPSGTIMEDNLFVTGSGCSQIYDSLKKNFKPNLTLDESISLALEIMSKDKKTVEKVFVDVFDNDKGVFRELSMETKKSLIK